MLWFAFILWFTDIDHNTTFKIYKMHRVVICFHSLIYWYWPQPLMEKQRRCLGCDLLSFFDLLILTTTFRLFQWITKELWFAFILWFTDIDHNYGHPHAECELVVICFHSLIYWYWPQLDFRFVTAGECCDLLSFFDLLILTTTGRLCFHVAFELWFAFILWFTDIDHNLAGYVGSGG